MKKIIFVSICILLGFISISSAQSWEQIGKGNNAIKANNYISKITIDKNHTIYAIGYFSDSIAVSKGHPYVAKWNGTSWVKLIGTNPFAAGSSFLALATDDMGNIYVAVGITNSLGYFYVAKWNGTGWDEVGLGANALQANNTITDLAIDSKGNLYAAGSFTDANSKCYIAKWNGTNWTEVGTGANALNGTSNISPIVIDKHDNIYVATYDATSFFHVAKWNGTNWAEVGTGANALHANNTINTIAIDSQDNVYAAGNFTDSVSGNNGVRYVAKWNGTNWAELGVGNNALKNAYPSAKVFTICIGNTGKVYAAGILNLITQNYFYVAEWDGTNWTELGGINSLKANSFIFSILSDNSGNIYAAGQFLDSLGFSNVARYNTLAGLETLVDKKNEIRVYPNPCEDKLLVNGYSLIGNSVEINDILGRTCISIVNQKSEIVNIESLPVGIYLLKVTDTKGNVSVGKFVKQ